MWFALTVSVSFVLAIVIMGIVGNMKNEKTVSLLSALVAILGFYSVISFFIFLATPTLEERKEFYEKSGMEAKALSSGSEMSLDLAYRCIADIKQANRITGYARKYGDNWYLGMFYYKELGDMEYISCDSIKLKIANGEN